MILADTLPDPNSYAAIGWVLVILAAITYGLNQGWELVNRFRGAAPEPPNGELKQSIKQLNARMKVLEDWRTQLTTKLESDKQEILDKGEDRARRIYDHMEAVRKELDEKIGDVPDKVIATLRNAGAIGGNHD